MSSLTEISITTRKLLLWSFIFLVLYFVFKAIIGIAIHYWKTANPPPLPPPDIKFGKIPAPRFTHIATSSSGLKFVLENIEGRPPETTTAGKVYFLPKKLPSLLASERAKKFAAKLNFTQEPEILTSTLYRFIDPNDNLMTLTLDINTGNFHLKYDFLKNPEIFEHEEVLTKEAILTEVKNYLQFNNLFEESILKGKTEIELLTYNPQTKTFLSVPSLNQAKIFRINFFRQDLDQLKILPPAFFQSYNYVLFVPALSPYPRIIEIAYTFWPIEFDNFGTYPLRSGQQAWQDLVDGYSVVVNLGQNNPQEPIIIRKIYLAYYDSQEPQNYLQPIFVFEGDNDFIAYLPAIDPNYLE